MKNVLLLLQMNLSGILLWLAFLVFPLVSFAGRDEQFPIPAHGQRGVVAPIFYWSAIEGATSYRFSLGVDPNDIQFIDAVEAPKDWYYYFLSLFPAQTYYWRVDGVLSDNSIATGALWQFTTLGLRAEEPAPEDDEKHISTQPVLSWVPGLTAYTQDIYWGTDEKRVARADTGWPEYKQTLGGKDRLFEPASLEPNTAYYWRVDSVELDGWTHTGSVWSFHTWPDIEISDPNLLVWWPFDENQGEIALDYSGYGHHCDLNQATWAEGREGSSLFLLGQWSGVQAPGAYLPIGDDPFTLMAWLQPHSPDAGQTIFYWGMDMPGMANVLTVNDTMIEHSFGGDRFTVDLAHLLEEWVHVTVMHVGKGDRRIAVNGTPQFGELVGTPNPQVLRSPIHVGSRPWPDLKSGFQGMIDDVRIYDYALNEVEVRQFIRGDGQRAGNPYPRDRALVDVEKVNPLVWEAGQEATLHDVYFGEDHRTVSQADTSTLDVYRGAQEHSRFTVEESLLLGKTYYWRVDERLLDKPLIRGDVWQFTVAEHLVLDDFESYTGRSYQRIYETWIDGLGFEEPDPGNLGNGSGATVGHWDPPYVEQVQIYAGSQSLPLYYDNADGSGVSQADRIFETPQDWTRRGITQLSLYISGLVDNTVESTDTFYVYIKDAVGQSALWMYPPEMVRLNHEQWQPVVIPIATMADEGLDVTIINQLSLGVGQPAAPSLGGKGIVFVDEIYLGIQQN